MHPLSDPVLEIMSAVFCLIVVAEVVLGRAQNLKKERSVQSPIDPVVGFLKSWDDHEKKNSR